jgi:hypothetical protein
MNELMRLAHEFLQNFCCGNQPNQALLHKHLKLFLTPGVISFLFLNIALKFQLKSCYDFSCWKLKRFVPFFKTMPSCAAN